MSGIVRECNITKGDKVLVRVEGGCKGVLKRRDLEHPEHFYIYERDPKQLSGANSTLRDPNGDGSLTYIWTDLGELKDGHYGLQVKLQGEVDNLTVLDAYGDVYYR